MALAEVAGCHDVVGNPEAPRRYRKSDMKHVDTTLEDAYIVRSDQL